jgi:hypothetical protein
MSEASKPRTRSITSLDLGDLRDAVDSASAASGVGPSTWIRELVRRELAGSGAAAIGRSPSAAGSPAVYRAWLDAALTAKLDRITGGGGFRTRAAALRGVIEGVNVGSGASAGLADAVQALGLSNHQLVALGRTLSDLGKAMQVTGAQPSAIERIAPALKALHHHLERAAALVAELRPLLKTQKGPP